MLLLLPIISGCLICINPWVIEAARVWQPVAPQTLAADHKPTATTRAGICLAHNTVVVATDAINVIRFLADNTEFRVFQSKLFISLFDDAFSTEYVI
jgi:hypothetical protein